MLEDNTERLERFAAVLRTLDPELPLRTWRDAHAMIREAGPLLPSAVLLSLDHDLDAEAGGPDPGDGYLVAQWLVAQPVVRPVIVHTSNGERASWMAGTFDLAGWRRYRVAPLGDDWVELDWRRLVHLLLKKARRTRHCT
ncbi:MAG TPA: cyclic-phosphate processing receiver domain-containing protein [Gemmataceae bacterium]|jgi:hypothetical protein|nr:cyclic-phosphate processing receiver domain-containing protein [Gemmataceae bacterium]